MAVDLFENQEDAENRFHIAVMRIASGGKKKLVNVWRRKPKQFCHICGKNMALPGEYLAIDGRKHCCAACYEQLPICGQCGKGSARQYCRECIRAR